MNTVEFYTMCLEIAKKYPEFYAQEVAEWAALTPFGDTMAMIAKNRKRSQEKNYEFWISIQDYKDYGCIVTDGLCDRNHSYRDRIILTKRPTSIDE